MPNRMLALDPMFRSPTAVPGTNSRLPWVMQLQLVPTKTESIFGDHRRSLHSIGAMTAAELTDRLVLNFQGQRVELPLSYLSLLWPKMLKLGMDRILFEPNDRLELSLICTQPVLVVLAGARPV